MVKNKEINKKLKILFVLENYSPHIGGAEIVFKNIGEGLVKQGHQVSLVTHQLKNTKKFEIINGVRVYRVPCFDNRYLFTFFSIPKVLKLAKKVDIIHTTTFNGAPPAWLASKICDKPCVITIHEVWVNQWQKITEMGRFKAFFHNTLEKLIYKLRFTQYVAVSNSTRNQLLKIKIPKSKTTTIYNGVDYHHWDPKRYNGEKVRERLKLKNNFIYLFHGRPGTSKGFEYLIKAVPTISKLIPNSKLLALVSKDVAYKKNYKKIIQLIKKLKIQSNLILHNPVSYNEVPNYVKSTDCVVVPSLAEGFGFSAAEACAMNKPVVASNTTSLPEVVSGRYILVKAKNPIDIAKGVVKVYQKEYNNKKLKKFGLKENIDNYLKAYRKVAYNK